MSDFRGKAAQGNPSGVFVTGTDTGVGKTFVAAAIARGLVARGKRVGVYKPAASGCERRDGVLVSEDAEMLAAAAQREEELAHVCPQRFAAPLAPHLAAKEEGLRIDRELLRSGVQIWRDTSEFVIVEGAGGLLSPISDEDLVADLATEFGYPLVIVAPNRIGVINQVLMTLEVARARDLSVASIVLNETIDLAIAHDPSRASNFVELKRLIAGVEIISTPWQVQQLVLKVCENGTV